MLLITNKQLSDMLRDCDYLIKSGAERLENRKGIQQGVKEINQGLGGIRTIQKVLNASIEAKTYSLNY